MCNDLTGSSVDFDSDQFNITIEAGEIIGYHNLSIACDEIIEENETFNLTLSLSSNNDQITIDHSTTIVQITDSTGECYATLRHYSYYMYIIVVVEFNQSSYDVRELDGAVMIELVMNRQPNQQFEVEISIIGITATSK